MGFRWVVLGWPVALVEFSKRRFSIPIAAGGCSANRASNDLRSLCCRCYGVCIVVSDFLIETSIEAYAIERWMLLGHSLFLHHPHPPTPSYISVLLFLYILFLYTPPLTLSLALLALLIPRKKDIKN